MAQALVLEKARQLALRDIDLPQALGPGDVRIAIDTVGICGSDVHYYTHGKIGPFVVTEPMVLGHEAAGRVTEIGRDVTHLSVGDRVCMEPGIPDGASKASKLGVYNVDPAVRFWATPPIHGCLTPSVVHPAAFTYRLPDHGELCRRRHGRALCHRDAGRGPGPDQTGGRGAGHRMRARSASCARWPPLAGGCAKVFVTDLVEEKLAVAARNTTISSRC